MSYLEGSCSDGSLKLCLISINKYLVSHFTNSLPLHEMCTRLGSNWVQIDVFDGSVRGEKQRLSLKNNKNKPTTTNQQTTNSTTICICSPSHDQDSCSWIMVVPGTAIPFSVLKSCASLMELAWRPTMNWMPPEMMAV